VTQEQIREDIGKLTAASESLAQSLDRLRTELHKLGITVQDNGNRLASMETQLTQLGEQLGEMRKAVLHGNGQPALISRVQQNVDRIHTLESKTKTMSANCIAHRDATLLSRNQVIVALIGLVGAVIASCASLVVTLMRS